MIHRSGMQKFIIFKTLRKSLTDVTNLQGRDFEKEFVGIIVQIFVFLQILVASVKDVRQHLNVSFNLN